jgi:hypothetical protein
VAVAPLALAGMTPTTSGAFRFDSGITSMYEPVSSASFAAKQLMLEP